jgi:deoxyribose-phosphate aldolase
LCHSNNAKCKAIIETFYLTEEEIIKLCRIGKEVGIDFIKTSTGFIKDGGAKIKDIEIMRQALGEDSNTHIKAAGGIRTLEIALKMIEAGAARLGININAAIAIIEEYNRRISEGEFKIN